MRNFVRGGIAFAVLGLFVILIFAQSQTEKTLSSANASRVFAESDIAKTETNKERGQEPKIFDQVQENNKNANSNTNSNSNVKRTVSSRKISSLAAGTFTATAYCLKGKTAIGHGVRRGIIAADPRILKLGSRVFVSAGAYSGDYLVSDTGGGVKGREIDIWMPSCSEARRFGRRKVTINPL
ncbi:MAG: hypothetical protein C4325_05290 [Blastocatellia bacterium]